jgi:hypothetical protein
MKSAMFFIATIGLLSFSLGSGHLASHLVSLRSASHGTAVAVR